MADPQHDTPSGNLPTSPAELALATLARALGEVSNRLTARLEVYRGLTEAERDVALSREADHLRDVKHLTTEAEQLLRALIGYRTPGELRVSGGADRKTAAATAKNVGIVMTALAALIGALAAAWSAMHGGGK